jgi:hypothetical protein
LGDNIYITSLAIDFKLIMHYIAPEAYPGSGRQLGDCARPQQPHPKIPLWRFSDVSMEMPILVRKSLTEKSGFIGLPAFPGQDSLVYGAKAQGPGFCQKTGRAPKKS